MEKLFKHGINLNNPAISILYKESKNKILSKSNDFNKVFENYYTLKVSLFDGLIDCDMDLHFKDDKLVEIEFCKPNPVKSKDAKAHYKEIQKHLETHLGKGEEIPNILDIVNQTNSDQIKFVWELEKATVINKLIHELAYEESVIIKIKSY